MLSVEHVNFKNNGDAMYYAVSHKILIESFAKSLLFSKKSPPSLA